MHSSHPTETPQARLANRIQSIATPDKLNSTRVSGLTIYSWDTAERHMHLVYRPSLCVLLQGEKVARVGSRTFHYDAHRFFFTAIPLPAELEVHRTVKQRLVGLVLEIDLDIVTRVALELEDIAAIPPDSTTSGIAFTGQLTNQLTDALDRLVTASSDPIRYQILHVAILREIMFELLIGPEGQALRSAIHKHGKLRPLVDVIRHLDEHSHEPVHIPQLAKRAAMSESTFFTRFRDATGATPLQYLKTLRLIKARALLASGADSVTEVAFSVGYASNSQFSRDFRKTFGHAPSLFKSAPQTR